MWKPGSDKPKNAAVNRPSEQNGETKPVVATDDAKRLTSKAALSQKTLAMKFMQRKNASLKKKQDMIAELHKSDMWVMDKVAESDVLTCIRDVHDPSLPLIFGRRSFGGFNKAIEEEYRDASRQTRFAESEARERREEISAEEMTSRMVKYTGLTRGPQSSKRPKKRTRTN